MIDEANSSQDRIRISFDVYPYNASSTVLTHESAECDPSMDILITWSTKDASATGRHLSELAKSKGLSVHDTISSLQPAGAVYFAMSEDDVKTVLSHSGAMVGSDGLICQPHPHPRLWGTFPRVLGHYCRDEKLFDLSAAVYKMTRLPAKVYGLKDRGVLKPGAYADIVVFDPATVIDTATFEHPITPAKGTLSYSAPRYVVVQIHSYVFLIRYVFQGIHLVMVNGSIVFENWHDKPMPNHDIEPQGFAGRLLRRELRKNDNDLERDKEE